jgi:hypothetical protein
MIPEEDEDKNRTTYGNSTKRFYPRKSVSYSRKDSIDIIEEGTKSKQINKKNTNDQYSYLPMKFNSNFMEKENIQELTPPNLSRDKSSESLAHDASTSGSYRVIPTTNLQKVTIKHPSKQIFTFENVCSQVEDPFKETACFSPSVKEMPIKNDGRLLSMLKKNVEVENKLTNYTKELESQIKNNEVKYVHNHSNNKENESIYKAGKSLKRGNSSERNTKPTKIMQVSPTPVSLKETRNVSPHVLPKRENSKFKKTEQGKILI